MNLLITCNTLPGQFAKVVTNDQSGYAHTLYFKGREMWVRMHGLMLQPFTQERLEHLRGSGFTVEVVTNTTELPTNERIALWCRLYKQFKGVPYRMNPKDVGNMKQLPVTEAVLTYYLNDAELPDNATTWLWKHKQSVRNLSTYWNEVVTAQLQPVPAKSAHPNTWSPEHLRKLDGPGITSYHQHLKSLGLVAKKHRDGSIINYVPHGTEQ